MPVDDETGEVQAFDPSRHLTLISGKDYLEVKWRLVWLRDVQPDAAIETELVRDDGANAVFRARVTLPSGGSATGWGQESYQDFGDYLEKAETKALGRALAALGFGTQFAGDFADAGDAGRPADSPVYRPGGGQGGAKSGVLATEKQVKAIYAIGRAAGLQDADMVKRAQEAYGKTPEYLSRQDASAFIDILKAGGSAPQADQKRPEPTAHEVSGKPEPKADQKPAQPPKQEAKQEPPAEAKAEKAPLPDSLKALWTAKTKSGWTDEQFRALLTQRHPGLASTRDLTEAQAVALRSHMQRAHTAQERMGHLWGTVEVEETLTEYGVAATIEMTDEQLTSLEALMSRARRDIGVVGQLAAAMKG